jgi:hypothetical protein
MLSLLGKLIASRFPFPLPEAFQRSGFKESDVPLLLKNLHLCSQGHLAFPLNEYGCGQGGDDDH